MQKLDRHAAGSLVLVDEAAEQVAAGSRDGLRRPARVRASGLLRTAHAPWTQEGHGSEPWPSRESDEGPNAAQAPAGAGRSNSLRADVLSVQLPRLCVSVERGTST